MKNIDIDSYFREGLSKFEQSPPDSSWDNITSKLNSRRKKRVAVLIFRIAAGMVILLSTAAILRMISRPDQQLEKHVLSSANPINKLPLHVNKLPLNEGVNHPENLKLPEKENTITKTSPALHSDLPVAVYYNRPFDLQYTADEPATDLAMIDDEAALSLKKGIVRHLSQSGISKTLTVNHSVERSLTNEEIIALLTDETVNNEETVKSGNKWLLGSEIAPLYSYRNIPSQSAESEVISNLNKNEDGIIAYAGGVRVAFSTGKRLSIQSGFYYSRYGQEKNHVNTYRSAIASNSYQNSEQVVQVMNSTGTINGINADNAVSGVDVTNNRGISANGVNTQYKTMAFQTSTPTEEVILKQYFDYLELPLIARYKVIDRKVDFSLSGGLITNFLVGNSVKMLQNGSLSNFGETSDINKINYQGSFGMGIEYPVMSNFDLTIEPRFRYYLNSIDKTSDISVHPFSFGFFAGFNYRF